MPDTSNHTADPRQVEESPASNGVSGVVIQYIVWPVILIGIFIALIIGSVNNEDANNPDPVPLTDPRLGVVSVTPENSDTATGYKYCDDTTLIYVLYKSAFANDTSVVPDSPECA